MAAQLARRPLVVFDPRDPRADRWNPLWSPDTGAVVSRLVAPVETGDGNARYYADLLQVHLGTVGGGIAGGRAVAGELAVAAARQPARPATAACQLVAAAGATAS